MTYHQIFCRKKHALQQDDPLRHDIDFVVSEKLTTKWAGYQVLHKWLGRPIPPVQLNKIKFKLSEILRKIYENNYGTKASDTQVFFTPKPRLSKRDTKNQNDVHNYLQSYYDFFHKQDLISSQAILVSHDDLETTLLVQ